MAKTTKKSAKKQAALIASALRPGEETAAPAVETTPAPVTPTAQQGEAPRRANLIVAAGTSTSKA